MNIGRVAVNKLAKSINLCDIQYISQICEIILTKA